MALARTGTWQRVRRFGTIARVAALAAGTALHPGPTLAQPAESDPAAGAALAATAPIEGFRQARFGMSEPEVRQAIRRDFPAAAARISRTIQPGEKTTVLAVTAEQLLPDAGPAQLFYILGYASKRLAQVNIVWSSDGRSAARDEAIVAAANALRDHFQARHRAPDEILVNHKLGENAFLVFRAAQADGRMVVLLLSGVAAAGRADRTLAATPLTLQLSYVRDHRTPDVFRIERGRF